MVRVNSNISYASIVSGNFNTKESLLAPSENYTFQSPYKQYFSLPFDVMKYILKNPKSPNGLFKLYKTCKYFYLKNQIIVPSVELEFTSKGEMLIHEKPISNILKLKLWFTDVILVLHSHLMHSYPFNLSNIYRATIKCLAVAKTNLDLDKLKILTSENLIERFVLCHSTIQDSNGKAVSIDAILQLMPKLKKLFYGHFEKFPLETLKSMALLKFENKLEKVFFCLENLAENFDPKLFFKFLKQNALPKKCFINFTCIGENADAIQMSLKSAEKEIFTKEEKSGMFQIHYNHPYDYR